MMDWQGIWDDDGGISRFSPTKTILYSLSLLYGLVVHLRNTLYDSQLLTSENLPCPVISVGNITVGGTGKTPCVIWLAQMLQARGFKPAILSRGYGGHSAASVNVVSDGRNILLQAAESGDEPLFIAQSLPGVPVLTGPRRIETGKAAIDRFGVNVLLCDDAFQHRQIVRDINLVLLDCQKPLGNGHVLPRGPLREFAIGLKRASCFLLTRCGEKNEINEYIKEASKAKGIPVFQSIHRARNIIKADGALVQSIDNLRGKKVCAFCGIAKPASFQKLLVKAGADVVSLDAFPDHYTFGSADVTELKDKFIHLRADYLITTQKDFMRLAPFTEFIKSLSILSMEMEIVPSPEPFQTFILDRLQQAVK